MVPRSCPAVSIQFGSPGFAVGHHQAHPSTARRARAVWAVQVDADGGGSRATPSSGCSAGSSSTRTRGGSRSITSASSSARAASSPCGRRCSGRRALRRCEPDPSVASTFGSLRRSPRPSRRRGRRCRGRSSPASRRAPVPAAPGRGGAADRPARPGARSRGRRATSRLGVEHVLAHDQHAGVRFHGEPVARLALGRQRDFEAPVGVGLEGVGFEVAGAAGSLILTVGSVVGAEAEIGDAAPVPAQPVFEASIELCVLVEAVRVVAADLRRLVGEAIETRGRRVRVLDELLEPEPRQPREVPKALGPIERVRR